MVKTKFDRIDVGASEVAAFRISGKLGFHENEKVQRLTEECLKRGFRTVVFDFSDLSSLGGGVAKILRDFIGAVASQGGSVRFVVTNDIVTQFLRDGDTPVAVYRSLNEALAETGVQGGTAEPSESQVPQRGQPTGGQPAPAVAGGRAAEKGPGDKPRVILMSYDNAGGAVRAEARERSGATERAMADARPPESGSPVDGETEEVISEIFGTDRQQAPPDRVRKPTSPSNEKIPQQSEEKAALDELNRQLKRRILELKTLFSISADFNAIQDRKKLIDIFLLTSIAQGGVESAAFLERTDNIFKPFMAKGLEPEALGTLEVPAGMPVAASGENNVIPIELFPMEEGNRGDLKEKGIEYVCPFRQKDGLAGLVLLGKRIAGRGMKEEDFEFLRILINIAQGAYDNALMFEHEHERTLGIVKSLISIIEENTLLKGTSEFVSRYVGMVAKNMDYPEENFKDLIYGAVLRDMGMVKVSDLILRSPRDLTKEEWEIIKRHPEDGAEMLSRMRFNEHVVSIVRTHHERFNGEGYPFGLRAKEIPLGARIISVVESYAAMIHERPNRPALSEREALDTLKENFGLRYDREVVMHFAKIIEKEIAQSVGYSAVAERVGER